MDFYERHRRQRGTNKAILYCWLILVCFAVFSNTSYAKNKFSTLTAKRDSLKYQVIENEDSTRFGVVNVAGDTLLEPVYTRLLIRDKLAFVQKNGIGIFDLELDSFIHQIDHKLEWVEGRKGFYRTWFEHHSEVIQCKDRYRYKDSCSFGRISVKRTYNYSPNNILPFYSEETRDWGLINTNFDTVLSPEYEDIYFNGPEFILYKNYASQSVDGSVTWWGIMDSSFKKLTDNIFKRVSISSNKNIFIVGNDDFKWGVLNQKLDTVFPFKYRAIKAAKHFVALQDTSKWCLYNSDYQFIDSLKKLFVHSRYVKNSETKPEDKILYYKNFKDQWGVLNFAREEVLPPEYNSIERYTVNGKGYTVFDNSYLLDVAKQKIIAGPFDYIEPIYCNDWWKSSSGILNGSGRLIFPIDNSDISVSHDNIYIKVSKGEQIQVFNHEFEKIVEASFLTFDEMNDSIFIAEDLRGRRFLYNLYEKKKITPYYHKLKLVNSYSNADKQYFEYSFYPSERYFAFLGAIELGSNFAEKLGLTNISRDRWFTRINITKSTRLLLPNIKTPLLTAMWPRKNKTGLIDITGNVIIAPNYSYIYKRYKNIWEASKRPAFWPIILGQESILQENIMHVYNLNGNIMIKKKEDYEKIIGDDNYLIIKGKDHNYTMVGPAGNIVYEDVENIQVSGNYIIVKSRSKTDRQHSFDYKYTLFSIDTNFIVDSIVDLSTYGKYHYCPVINQRYSIG